MIKMSKKLKDMDYNKLKAVIARECSKCNEDVCSGDIKSRGYKYCYRYNEAVEQYLYNVEDSIGRQAAKLAVAYIRKNYKKLVCVNCRRRLSKHCDGHCPFFNEIRGAHHRQFCNLQREIQKQAKNEVENEQ